MFLAPWLAQLVFLSRSLAYCGRAPGFGYAFSTTFLIEAAASEASVLETASSEEMLAAETSYNKYYQLIVRSSLRLTYKRLEAHIARGEYGL